MFHIRMTWTNCSTPSFLLCIKSSLVNIIKPRRLFSTRLIVLFLFFSCFFHLAEGFEVKRNYETEVGEFSQYFPHFIWLLRDVSLITSDDGQGGEMDPTEYIKTKVCNL